MRRTFRSAVTMAAVLAAALAPTACKRETQENTPASGATRLAANEVENLRYIRSNTAVGVPHRLNLADPKQYAYVEATLRRFRRTPESSPRLFELLQQARAGTPSPPVAVGARLVPRDRAGSGGYAHLARVRGAGAAPAGSPPYQFAAARTALAQAPSGSADSAATLGGVNYTTDFGRNNDGSYYTNAYSTYPDSQIPYNTHIMVTLVDASNNNVLSQADSNVFSRTNVKVPLSAAAPSDSSVVTSNTLILVAPQQGAQLEAYSVQLEDRADVVSPCQLSPNYGTAGT
ncbi:MAG TPA: hypothetical protein VFS20_11940, partial [Longimicrobium sp.]|nr:hypothetical protein [Longimicrobium sp.]